MLMKNMFCKWLAGLILISMLSGPAWAEGKIAIVDLRKIFDGYWKKKQAEATLKDRETDMAKEDKNMNDDYKKANEEYQALLTSANDQNASPEEREKRKKSAADKLKQLGELRDTITQYERQASATLREQSARMRGNILTEIRDVVTAKAKAAGFSMVVDTTAESLNSTPVILYTDKDNDLTNAVLLQLNATAPVETPKPEEKPAEKKDQKKDSKK